jgi:acetolactate synthase-1/2/3 large subunit
MGGGLFACDGQTARRIDRLSTTGLHVAGSNLLRVLRATALDSACELLLYDSRGVRNYYRIDGAGDAHDVFWDGNHCMIVSPGTNSILWVTAAGETARVWRAPGEDDSWHLNCLAEANGELHVSAFGRFSRHREWSLARLEPTGMIFNLRTGKDAVTGLAQPHHPRFVDKAWIVCNSATNELLQIHSSTVQQRLQLNGFTRGLAVADDFLFVGESVSRRRGRASDTAHIAVVTRDAWKVVRRIPLPATEIYDLALVDPSLIEGAERGFNTNYTRVSERTQYSIFEETGIELARLPSTSAPLQAPDGFRSRLTADLPHQLGAGATVSLQCVIENCGGMPYVSAPPYPVQLGYRWIDPLTSEWVDETAWLRAKLPRGLAPGEKTACHIKMVAPTRSGRYICKLSLVQEFIAWFDDVDGANGLAQMIDVGSR